MNRIIQWFVDNPVAANLIMVMIFLGGFFSVRALDKEAFPAVETGVVEISAPYPGAGPKEVEEQILIRIEEAIGDLDGIEEISSRATRGNGRVRVEAIQGYDVQELLNDVEARVDAIDTFPEDAEQLQVREQQWRSRIMDLAVHGEVREEALKETAQLLRDDLAALPNVSVAELAGVRDDEMAIELSEESLRRHNLSFDAVYNAIRGASLNLPAGSIDSFRGDIQVQTRGQAYFKEDFEQIVVDSRTDGALLRLGDVADVRDGFVENDVVARLDGSPAVYVRLYITDDPNVLKAREQVYDYLEEARQTVPPAVDLTLWRDDTVMFQDRVSLLLENALTGLLLVFTVLVLTLRPVLASWVCVGIAIAFTGALWLLPYTGVSLNMISLFGFLLVLGIVVDDAIIVGESIYSRYEQGQRGRRAAAHGAQLVAKPVIFAVISTMVFFAPLLFVPGEMGTMSAPIGVIVILCLVFSLVESLWILPSHLSHLKPERPRNALSRQLANLRGRVSGALHGLSVRGYQPLLRRALRHHPLTLACFAVAFLLSLAVFAGGWLRISFTPAIEADQIDASITLREGVPFSESLAVTERLQEAAEELRSESDLLADNDDLDFVEHIQVWTYGNNIRFALALQPPEDRALSAQRVARRWRDLIGEVPQAEEVRVNFTINSRSEAVRLRMGIRSDRTEDQEQAVEAVKAALAEYPGTRDIKDNLQAPRDEIELALKPRAEVLGMTLNDIARQVRRGFYGAEVQRIPRAKEDVPVMLRYTREERRDLGQLQHMRIRGADGGEMPLQAVAETRFVPGYSTIRRLDRQRTITVTSDLEPGYNANEIVSDLIANNRARWEGEFPGFNLEVAGNLQDQNDFLDNMTRNFMLSLVAIYGLMAVAFRSYWQPLIVLTAIPFGFMGAVLGHLIMGREVSMLSMLGFVACAGVVVNDNLVLLDRVNRYREEGLAVMEAVTRAGRDRFRAIVLTSVTTFVGLTPILFEKSMQASFLIPMVISLAFGVVVATTVTLILVPCLFYAAHRLGLRWHQWRGLENSPV